MLFSPLSDTESQVITGGNITFYAPIGIANQALPGPDKKAVVPANPANSFSEGTNPGIGFDFETGFVGPAFTKVPTPSGPVNPGFIQVKF